MTLRTPQVLHLTQPVFPTLFLSSLYLNDPTLEKTQQLAGLSPMVTLCKYFISLSRMSEVKARLLSPHVDHIWVWHLVNAFICVILTIL